MRGLGTTHAKSRTMMDVALTILALIAGGFMLELFAAGRAQLESSDHGVFRLPVELPQPTEEYQCGNPS